MLVYQRVNMASWEIPELCHCALLGKSSKSVGDFEKSAVAVNDSWVNDRLWQLLGDLWGFHGPLV